MEMVLGFLVMLGCLLFGVHHGGIGLAVISGIGLAVYTFVFGYQPGVPPISVMLTILAVVTCAGFLQTSGGLTVMLKYAERLLRNNPKQVTIFAPVTTWLLTVLCGTGHVVCTMFPIIYDVAIKQGIRRCLDGEHIFQRTHGDSQGLPRHDRAGLSVGLCHHRLFHVEARELAGGGHRHRRADGAQRRRRPRAHHVLHLRVLRLLLPADVSVGSRVHRLRPLGHDAHRQVLAESQLHDSGLIGVISGCCVGYVVAHMIF